MRLDLEAPDRAAPCCSAIAFEVDGQHYSLMPQEEWDRQHPARRTRHPNESRPVGKLMVNGIAHVVLEAEDVTIEATDDFPSTPSAADLLTRREFEIAMLVANGKCDKEIARALGISGYTVREHIRRTFAKLGVSRRTAIVSYVLRSLKSDMRS
jgi:DNA-binding CsgD family transcriptional regulator